jgi:hypothetical protein
MLLGNISRPVNSGVRRLCLKELTIMSANIVKLITLAFIISFWCYPIEAQPSQVEQLQQTSKIPTVEFCEMLRHPNLYARKEVRVRALYTLVFEVSAFSSSDCKNDEYLTWVEFDNSVERSTEPEILKKFRKQMIRYMDERWVIFDTELLVTGLLDNAEAGYGHLGMYRFLFTVKSIEKVGKTKKIDLNKR